MVSGNYKIVLVRADPNYGERSHKGGTAAHLLKTCLQQVHFAAQLDVDIVELNSCWQRGIDLYVAWILEREPQLLGFSCYCWNRELTAVIAMEIKRLRPEVIIVGGGPEVSFDAPAFLTDHPAFDVVVRGEGERTICELVETLLVGKPSFADIHGLVYRHAEGIITTPDREPISDLDTIPSPVLEGSIDPWQTDGEVVLETVRGCQYKCTYCLHTKGMVGVRSFSWERIEAEIKFLCKHPAIKVIWIADPTFNADEERALRICDLILRYNPMQGIAFELRAELLSRPLIAELAKLNVVDVGIGLQSTNPKTLRIIRRPADLKRFFANIRELQTAFARKGTRIDLDVIYGLPGDSYDEYLQTVNMALQVGGNVYFQPLRVFRGAAIAADAQQWGIHCMGSPPYNALYCSTFPMSDMIRAYQLNAGIDFYQCGVSAVRSTLDVLAHLTGKRVGEIAHNLGEFLWQKRLMTYFRVSNATPNDIPASWRIHDLLLFLETVASAEIGQDALLPSRHALEHAASLLAETNEQSGYYHAAL